MERKKTSESRRDFLKKSAITAAGVSVASVSPFASNLSGKLQQKSKVVICKNDKCSNGSSPVQTEIENMIDLSVMCLTGINEKSKAYEALFPEPVTESTKIVIKRNDVSAPRSWSNQTVVEAIKTGLTSMLGGYFPPENVSLIMKSSNTSSSTSYSFENYSTNFQQVYVDADWIINCPVCCAGHMALVMALHWALKI